MNSFVGNRKVDKYKLDITIEYDDDMKKAWRPLLNWKELIGNFRSVWFEAGMHGVVRGFPYVKSNVISVVFHEMHWRI